MKKKFLKTIKKHLEQGKKTDFLTVRQKAVK